MIIAFNHGSLPIKPIKEVTIEAKVTGGLATIKQKREVIKATLALACAINIQGTPEGAQVHAAGTELILVPDAAHQPWNKQILTCGDIEFVLVPMSAVIGLSTQAVQG